MWGNQGYDGGGFDHGGGYIGGSQGNKQGGSERKKPRSSTILPCTVGQLMGAEQVEAKYVCGGIELNQVSLVGIVRSAQATPTSHVYEIDDMTGPMMNVRTFIDSGVDADESEKHPPIPENVYVYLNGLLRAYNGKKSVTAFKIRRIQDMNEITTHMLEVVYAHLLMTKQNQPGHVGAPNPSSSVPQGSFFVGDDSGLTQQQSKVLNVIGSSAEEYGVNVSIIAARLETMSPREIENAVEFLSNEGYIYSTIDDRHFKATDA